MIETDELNKFKKELIAKFGEAMGEEKGQVWIKDASSGYFNYTLDKEIMVITVYYYEEEEILEKLAEALKEVVSGFSFNFGIDLHLVGDKYYKSFFSKENKKS